MSSEEKEARGKGGSCGGNCEPCNKKKSPNNDKGLEVGFVGSGDLWYLPEMAKISLPDYGDTHTNTHSSA